MKAIVLVTFAILIAFFVIVTTGAEAKKPGHNWTIPITPTIPLLE